MLDPLRSAWGRGSVAVSEVQLCMHITLELLSQESVTAAIGALERSSWAHGERNGSHSTAVFVLLDVVVPVDSVRGQDTVATRGARRG